MLLCGYNNGTLGHPLQPSPFVYIAYVMHSTATGVVVEGLGGGGADKPVDCVMVFHVKLR